MDFYFRKNTNDSLIFESIFVYDEYKLPDSFLETDIIIDIGTHVGFFSYAVAQRGARHIYAFEPDQENFNIATKHLKDYIAQGSVSLTRGAVWRSDVHQKELVYSGYSTDDNYINTGAGNVLWHKEGAIVPAIPFDEVILRATQNGQQKVRLLKLDCEGSEWPILFTSTTLHLIDEICGEFHEVGGTFDQRTSPISLDDLNHLTIDGLVTFLEKESFSVSYARRLNADGTLRDGGIFIATKTLDDAGKGSISVRPAQKFYAVPREETTAQERKQPELPNAEEGLNLFAGHTSWTRYVAYCPNGSKMLMSAADGTIGVWETVSGQLLSRLEGSTGVLVSAAFSSDGKKILTGTSDQKVQLWETTSGRLVTRLEEHTSWLVGAAFSVDGSKGCTVSYDGMVRLWDIANGQLLAAYQGYTEIVAGAAFSADRSRGIAGSYNGIAWLWETMKGRIMTTLDGHADTVVSMVFSPNGRQVMTGSYDKTARLWDVHSGRLLRTLEGHTGPVRSVAFSPDGRQVMTGSYDKTARLWDVHSGRLLRILEGHTDILMSSTFLADGRKGLTVSYDRMVRLWELESGQFLTSLHVTEQEVAPEKESIMFDCSQSF